MLEGHNDCVFTVEFNHTGTYVVSTSEDEMIRIWDVATGKLYRVLIGHNDSVVYACFNTYNTMITSASSDQTVRIWDIESGTCLHILDHDDSVSSSIFNKDGSQVITYSDN